ncbi:MAG: DoxX family protein [Actinomycetes bacterium]
MPGTETMRRGRWATASPYALAGLLGVTGSLHFIVPRAYAQIVPSQLPAPYALVYASGVAELLCAAGLAMPRTRRLAGWATVALFVAVFPANVQMALDSGGRSVAYQAGTWARLPLQLPLVWWGASVARATSGGRRPR